VDSFASLLPESVQPEKQLKEPAMKIRLIFNGVVILLCTVLEAAAAIPIYDNGASALAMTGNPSFFWGYDSSSGETFPVLMLADDFRLTSDSILTSVKFWTLTPFDGGNSGTLTLVKYSILPDEGGVPGSTPVAAGIGIITSDVVTGRVTGGQDSHREREVAFDLSAPVQLSGEHTYWLGLAVAGTDRSPARTTKWAKTDGSGNSMVTSLSVEPPQWTDNGVDVAFVLNGSVGLVPCDASWKNHGQYVSIVAHMANQLLADGVITEAERDAMVEAAAESNCGKKR
jgi:hypothetical protein